MSYDRAIAESTLLKESLMHSSDLDVSLRDVAQMDVGPRQRRLELQAEADKLHAVILSHQQFRERAQVRAWNTLI